MKTESQQILGKYDTTVAVLGLELREFLLTKLDNIIEQPDIKANVIGFGYGPGYKDSICTIIPSKKGIKLGSYKGSELPDPGKLLTSSGKVHKYVEVTSSAVIKSAALKRLLKVALIAHEKRK